jgi:ABC-2 type transport system ATP-binding protein
VTGRPAWPASGLAAGASSGGWGTRELCVWQRKTLALDRVSLCAKAGQVTAVVGGDGAGKTTLLRCLAGALAPGRGEVRRPAVRRIGYQSAGSGTYPDLTVDENLAFRAAGYGLPPAGARDRADEYLARAGLAAARGKLAGDLSGGMRHKLGVIAAMMHQPDLLVLDEPTTGVDPVSRSDLWWLIARAAASGSAVVLATSYLDEAQRAEAVLFLDAGRVLAAGTPEQIIATVPGTLRALPGRPAGPDPQRAWRRGGQWRVWDPEAAGHHGRRLDQQIAPDLQDAVTIAALAREPEPAADESGSAGQPVRPRSAGPLAQCAAVSRNFGPFTAVRDADLQVGAGEIVGLLGANGAGKTTLIRMLLGLLTTSAGQVALFGEPPSRGTRRRIGYVPQGLGLYDDLTATENLEFSAAVFGGAPAGLPPGLARYSAEPAGALPLGVQRRVAFAQALAHQPELLILDEPTSGVDPLGRARLWDTIRQAAENGAGVLVTTHYLEEAQECSRLVIMADGAVVAEGTAAQIIGEARVTVVDAQSWAAAFGALEQAGLATALAGRRLRVPGASPDEVRRVLAAATRATEMPATEMRATEMPATEMPAAATQVTGPRVAGPRVTEARVTEEPATLQERFFQLTLPGSRTPAAR